jgi:hypothetical protein
MRAAPPDGAEAEQEQRLEPLPEVGEAARPTSSSIRSMGGGNGERTGALGQPSSDDHPHPHYPTPPGQGRYPVSPTRWDAAGAGMPPSEYHGGGGSNGDDITIFEEVKNREEEEEEEEEEQDGYPTNVSYPGASPAHGAPTRKRRHGEADYREAIAADDEDDEDEEIEESDNASVSRNGSKGRHRGGGEMLSEADKNSNAAVASLTSSCHHVHVLGGAACGEGGAGASAPDSGTASSPPTLDLTHFYEAMAMINPTERRGWD